MTPIKAAVVDPTDFLNRLSAYDQSEGTDTLLDLARELVYSGNYYWVGASFPYGNLTTVPAFGTSNGSIALPPGTYITAINYYGNPEINPQRFKLVMFDKGTRAPIAYGGNIFAASIGSDMQLQNQTGSVVGQPFGQGFLISPFIVTPPGVISWEIANMSQVAAVIQVMLCCAVPIRDDTIGARRIVVSR